MVLCFSGRPLAQSDPRYEAALDSLAAWHHQSRPDRVDSFMIAELENIRRIGDPDLLRRFLLAGGTTRAAFGMAARAEPNLEEACQLARAAHDSTSLLQGLRWLAVAVGRQGRSAEAAALYQELNTLATAHRDSVHLGWAQLGLAYDHYLAGRSSQAIASYGVAAELLDQQGIPRGALWAYNGQGLALRQEGAYQEAMKCFRRSLQLARAQGDPLNEAMALNYLGRLELMFADPEVAIAHLTEAARIHQDHQHHREGLLPLLDIARERVQQGWYATAESLLTVVQTQAERDGLEDLVLLAVGNLADLRMAQGRPRAAGQLCREALLRPTFPSAMNPTELRLRWAASWARQEGFAEALAVLEPDLVTLPVAHSLQLQVLLQAAEYALDLGQADRSLAWVDRGLALAQEAEADQFLVPLLSVRGRALYHLNRLFEADEMVAQGLARWEIDRAIPADFRWREQRSAGARQLFGLGLTLAATDSAGFNLLQRYKARTLLERMSGPGKSRLESFPPLTLARLQGQLLAPDQALLDVFVGPRHSRFYLVTRDTLLAATITDNGRSQEGLRQILDALKTPVVLNPAVIREKAVRCWQVPAAFVPVLENCTQLTWCPDGFWHEMPLALWRGSAGLRVDVLVTRTPAACFLRNENQTEESGSGAGILAMAGPAPDPGMPWYGSLFETAWLDRHFTQVGVLDTARLATLEKALPPGGILHLAAHTEVDGQQPWNTALLLGTGTEGRLRAEQVARQNLPAALVVLSSCRTAGTGILYGEGLQGMTTGFLAAGARSVLATLWPVDDRTAALFMTDFYAALGQGQTVAEACR
nr:CHAT domain-containing protein [Candidatus Krumholzibacteria bacterium]